MPLTPPHDLQHDLQHDCTQCMALCCVAPSFDAVQGFGYDKPAHTACRHLATNHRCQVHGDLAGAGFPACAAFDCHGAGQRATAQFGGPQAVLDAPTRQRLYAHYQRLVRLHGVWYLLHVAAEAHRDATVQAALAPAAQRLAAASAQPPHTLTEVVAQQLQQDGLAALRGIAHRLRLPR
jgi:hypothetical protein